MFLKLRGCSSGKPTPCRLAIRAPVASRAVDRGVRSTADELDAMAGCILLPVLQVAESDACPPPIYKILRKMPRSNGPGGGTDADAGSARPAEDGIGPEGKFHFDEAVRNPDSGLR